jgi:protein dithiol:quinone oxidoreductase
VIRRPLWLAGIAAVGIGAVGAALVSQHVYGMQPCPWCVLQRVIFLAIAAAALLALVLPGLLRGLFLLVLTALAASGVAAAVWQHFVAASAASCNLTLADRIVGTLTLDALWPEVFMATATCAEAKVNLFGLPYEAWSGLLFAVMALIGLRMLLGKPGRRR